MPKTSEARQPHLKLDNSESPSALPEGIGSTWSTTPVQLFQQQLNWALQRTLRVETQLQIYFHALIARFQADGTSFTNTTDTITLTLGQEKSHQCQFDLFADNEHLGKLIIYRGRRFTPEEISSLESSTLSLAYPLRNALQFQHALKNALTDPLTSAGNRMAMEERLAQGLQSFHRYHRPLSIAMFDLDYFKRINDKHGHQAGDRVLKHLVSTIQANSRSTDAFFRYGGEEFLMLMSDTETEGALIKAERLRALIAGSSCLVDHKEIPITVSIGLATAIVNDDERSIIQRADEALYEAKKSGRNQVIFSAPLAKQPEGTPRK